MQVEFETQIRNGIISIPQKYIPEVSETVKVIVIYKENLANPKDVLKDIQRQAANSPLREMSLKEINEEINAYRKENFPTHSSNIRPHFRRSVPVL